MTFDIGNINLSEEPTALEIKKLKSYVFQLTEQLRYTLNNIEASNMTQRTRDVLQQSQKSSLKIVELTEQQQQDYKRLRDAIVQNAVEIARDYESQIDKTDQAIRSMVSSYYVAKSEGAEEGTVNQLKDFVATFVEQRAESIEYEFHRTEETVSGMQQDILDNKDSLEQYRLDLETYIRFSEAGIEIGKLENGISSPFSVLISNEKISFRNYAIEVAYIMYNKLFITDVQITNKLMFGSDVVGYYEFIPRASGNLSIRWRR